MDAEPIVHLALSPKAAKMLDQLIDYGGQHMDGCATEYIDDPDGDLNSILGSIRAEIKEQLPAKKARTKKSARRTKK